MGILKLVYFHPVDRIVQLDSTTFFNLGSTSGLTHAFLLITQYLYNLFMVLLLSYLFFDSHLEMDLQRSEIFLNSLKNIPRNLTVILILIVPVFILSLIITGLLINFETLGIYMIVFIFLLISMFLSFIIHDIVVHEYKAFKSNINSIPFVSNHFFKVLIFEGFIALISYGMLQLKNYLIFDQAV
ncbi:MAG: hypothetical protein JXR88_02255 [Clostridia bacterium]|nr:hypothetical protein [Clostridia bacterium]